MDLGGGMGLERGIFKHKSRSHGTCHSGCNTGWQILPRGCRKDEVGGKNIFWNHRRQHLLMDWALALVVEGGLRGCVINWLCPLRWLDVWVVWGGTFHCIPGDFQSPGLRQWFQSLLWSIVLAIVVRKSFATDLRISIVLKGGLEFGRLFVKAPR